MILKMRQFLPEFLLKMPEYQNICIAIDALFEKLGQEYQDVANDQHIDTLTESGCERWEKILGLKVQPDDTIEDRRRRIQMYTASNLPYTIKKIKSLVYVIAGDTCTVDVDYPNYSLNVGLQCTNAKVKYDIDSMIQRLIPANMIYNSILLYNTHEELKPYKHSQLHTLTHAEVRSDVPISHYL